MIERKGHFGVIPRDLRISGHAYFSVEDKANRSYDIYDFGNDGLTIIDNASYKGYMSYPDPDHCFQWDAASGDINEVHVGYVESGNPPLSWLA